MSYRAWLVSGLLSLVVVGGCRNRDEDSLPSTDEAWSPDLLDGNITLSLETSNALYHFYFHPEAITSSKSEDDTTDGAGRLDIFSMGIEESLRRTTVMLSALIENSDELSSATLGLAKSAMTTTQSIRYLYEAEIEPSKPTSAAQFESWLKTNRDRYARLVREYSRIPTSLVSIRDSMRTEPSEPTRNVAFVPGVYALSPSQGGCLVEVFLERSEADASVVERIEIAPDSASNSDSSCNALSLICTGNDCKSTSEGTPVRLSSSTSAGFSLVMGNTAKTFLRRDVGENSKVSNKLQISKDSAKTFETTQLFPFFDIKGQLTGMRAEFYDGKGLAKVGHYLCKNTDCWQECSANHCPEKITLSSSTGLSMLGPTGQNQ